MLRRPFHLIPAFCSAGACIAVATWIASRLATDRWIATQLLFWIPSSVYLVPAALLAILGVRPFRRWGRAPAPPMPRRTATVPAKVSLLLALFALAWIPLGEWRLHRVVFPATPPPPASSLRIVHWNLSSIDESFRPEQLVVLGGEGGADAFFLTTLVDSQRLSTAAALLGPDFTLHRLGTFALISRINILSLDLASLGIPDPGTLAEEAITGEPTAPHRGPYANPLVQRLYNRTARLLGVRPRSIGRPDPGVVVRLRLDATASLGRPLSVWFIDLPSSPLAPRYALAKAAAARLELLRLQSDAPPDVLIGDFNIPRGSASLGVLTAAVGGMTNAFDQAGHGPMASWPRERPLWLIDNLFTAPTVRVARYTVVDPGVSEHRAQSAVLTSAPMKGPPPRAP